MPSRYWNASRQDDWQGRIPFFNKSTRQDIISFKMTDKASYPLR